MGVVAVVWHSLVLARLTQSLCLAAKSKMAGTVLVAGMPPKLLNASRASGSQSGGAEDHAIGRRFVLARQAGRALRVVGDQHAVAFLFEVIAQRFLNVGIGLDDHDRASLAGFGQIALSRRRRRWPNARGTICKSVTISPGV